MGLAEAEKELEGLLENLKLADFHASESVEREFSILDTNVFLDDGWLFAQNPENFIVVQ
jgi:hypothetical protein